MSHSKLFKHFCHKGTYDTSPVADKLDISPEGISVPFLLVGFFAYVALGAVILPQYEEMDFFTACYFSFISITTGD